MNAIAAAPTKTVEIQGGSYQPALIKKTEEKVTVLGAKRCVYTDCKQRKYVKMDGVYVRLTEARNKEAAEIAKKKAAKTATGSASATKA